jgi:hypothetical protein
VEHAEAPGSDDTLPAAQAEHTSELVASAAFEAFPAVQFLQSQLAQHNGAIWVHEPNVPAEHEEEHSARAELSPAMSFQPVESSLFSKVKPTAARAPDSKRMAPPMPTLFSSMIAFPRKEHSLKVTVADSIDTAPPPYGLLSL